MNSAEAVFILVGADVVFNKGQLTSKIINCFHDVLKLYYDKKPVTYVVSQKDLIDAGFEC
ncbi:MAG: hypothetical protein PHU34_11325 [Candidatus Methanoperedens sp.]|nr:hypothetical protein [Candidatus Methanoperedens sp.]